MLRLIGVLALLPTVGGAQDASPTLADVTAEIEGRLIHEGGTFQQYDEGGTLYFKPQGGSASRITDLALDRETYGMLMECVAGGKVCRATIDAEVDIVGSEIRLLVVSAGPPSVPPSPTP